MAIDSLVRGVTTDYEPFGALAYTTSFGRQPSRQGFIDKENDRESGLGDFGVRKYEPETGRFLSVDALWEKYSGSSPYGYAGQRPLTLVDPSGMIIEMRGRNEDEIQQAQEYFDGQMARLKAHDADSYRRIKAMQDDPNVVVGFRLIPFDQSGAPGYHLNDREVQVEAGQGLRYTDANGQSQTLSPAAIFAHELAGHAYAALFADRAVSKEGAVVDIGDHETYSMSVEHTTAVQLGDVDGGPRVSHAEGDFVVWQPQMRAIRMVTPTELRRK